MIHCRDISLEIVCDGHALTEYRTTTDDRTTTCFIASQINKTFYIGERNSLDTTVALDCYIDGQHMGGMLCDPGEYTLDEGLRVGLGRLRTYKFVPVETYDDIPTIAQHPHPDQVGTIEIRAFRARTCYPTRITRTNQFPATYQVHEATKLGAMHCVSVGHELDVDVEETDADLIDPLDNPYAIFKIFYRPIEILRSRGIIRNRVLSISSLITSPCTPKIPYQRMLPCSTSYEKPGLSYGVGVKAEHDDALVMRC